MGVKQRNEQVVAGIGKRLQQARESASLSRQELAEKSGCHYDTLVKVELGHRGVTLKTLAAVATALQVDVQTLVANGG